MNQPIVSYKNYNFIIFFQICFMSVDNVVKLMIISDYRQSGVSMSYLDEDLL
jgi:hypothetical protein